MTDPAPTTLPSDTELLQWMFGKRSRIRKLMTALDWDSAQSLDVIRAAIALDMSEVGEPLEDERGSIEDFVLSMRDSGSARQQARVALQDSESQRITAPMPVRRAARPHFPEKFKNVTLDSFDPTISGPEWEQQLRQAKRAVERWVELAAAGKPAQLALVGAPGNGKSTLLWGAVDALHSRNVVSYARAWYRLADELRYGGNTPWNQAGKVLEANVLRLVLYDTQVVALDEVCPTAGTQFDEAELGKLVKNAYDNSQALIITTNVWPLTNIMDPAAADRFVVVQLNAPSRRQA